MEIVSRFGLSGTRIIASSALALSMLIGIGSGGNAYVSSTSIPINQTNNIWHLVDKVKEKVSKNHISEQVDTVKKAFSLKDEEVSQILGISRKTLHTWKSNAVIPKDKSRQAFFDLYVQAKDWLELGYPSDRASIFSKNPNGESIFTLLCDGNRDKVLFMGRYLLRNADNGELI